jgi:hypothetical protein
MIKKRLLITAALLIAVAAVFTLGALQLTQPAQAQTDEAPATVGHISFGMISIAPGQTMRLNVVNALPPGPVFPPGPTRVVLTFLDADGNRLRHRDGTIVRRAVQLERGQATFLDFNFDEYPPGPTRLQLRAVVNVFPIQDTRMIPYDSAVPSIEIFNNSNPRTVVAITNPGVVRGFNPQPDPPL